MLVLGVQSSIDANIRRRILSKCKQHSPNHVAVSYWVLSEINKFKSKHSQNWKALQYFMGK